MSHRFSNRAAALKGRLLGLCPEREILLHSGDQVRYFRLSRRVQLLAVGLTSAVLLGWGGLTLSMIAGSASVAQDRAALARQNRSVTATAARVDAYRRSVAQLAQDIKTRQDFIDDLYKTHFGGDEDKAQDGGMAAPTKAEKAQVPATDLSLAPQAAPLVRLEQRQRRFATLLTATVRQRADQAAAAIRSFGLNPDRLARSAARAQGGPFVPWKGDRDALTGELERLADALTRMELLERSLLAIPSGKPTAAPMETSSYGYRRDPFNGHAAFHAGIDFPGRFAQPIQAAAAGRISYVGQRQGYGNVVEVDHGNGLMTRYAHLSGFAARIGQKVARGDTIARMGSTGRSTGTHLHFEVRINGEAINPRRFLEARQDVLQLQQIAKARFADVDNRG